MRAPAKRALQIATSCLFVVASGRPSAQAQSRASVLKALEHSSVMLESSRARARLSETVLISSPQGVVDPFPSLRSAESPPVADWARAGERFYWRQGSYETTFDGVRHITRRTDLDPPIHFTDSKPPDLERTLDPIRVCFGAYLRLSEGVWQYHSLAGWVRRQAPVIALKSGLLHLTWIQPLPEGRTKWDFTLDPARAYVIRDIRFSHHGEEARMTCSEFVPVDRIWLPRLITFEHRNLLKHAVVDERRRVELQDLRSDVPDSRFELQPQVGDEVRRANTDYRLGPNGERIPYSHSAIPGNSGDLQQERATRILLFAAAAAAAWFLAMLVSRAKRRT